MFRGSCLYCSPYSASTTIMPQSKMSTSTRTHSRHRTHSYIILHLHSRVPIQPHKPGPHINVTPLSVCSSLRSARKCLGEQTWSLESLSPTTGVQSRLEPFRYELRGALRDYRAKSVVDTLKGGFSYEVLGIWEVPRFRAVGGDGKERPKEETKSKKSSDGDAETFRKRHDGMGEKKKLQTKICCMTIFRLLLTFPTTQVLCST